MKKHIYFVLILFFVGFFLGLGISSAFAEKVVYVIDGDTVVLDNHERVRLIGVDTPEINSKYHRGEFYGKEAKKYLKQRIEGKEVTLKNGSEAVDKYGRRLAYIYLPDGAFVNEELVKLGYAQVFRSKPCEYQEQFLKLEEEAKTKHLGMWSARKRPWWMKRFS